MDDALRMKIEKRAYEFYLARGNKPGNHQDDWIKAEKAVLTEEAAKKRVETPVQKKAEPVIEKKPAAPAPAAKKPAPPITNNNRKK
jgi:hypothetical protein